MCSYLDQVGATYYFRRAVPKDLVGYFLTGSGNPRTEWKFSLGTKDREAAKRLLRPHEIETDKLIDDARAALAKQSGGEAAASSGATLVDDPIALEQAEAVAALEAEKLERYKARKQHRIAVRKRMQLSTVELTSEEAAWRDVIREQGAELERLRGAAEAQEAFNYELGKDRIGQGRYSSLMTLFDIYAQSGTANPKTIRRWRSRVDDLITHLGHDNAAAVTRQDLNGWIAALVSRGLQGKTIRDGYLPAVSAAFGIAYEGGAMLVNPMAGLKVRAPKPVKLRDRDLTDDEAATILRESLAPPPPKLADHHVLARRWVPWLCAYTGARVGETTQLRAMDIRQEAGIWCIHITPEAGSVKTNEARLVPLHSHLISQGFVDLAKAGDETPLFYDKDAGNEINPGSKIRAAALAKWARSLGVTAPQPNHGWRHRFKTMTRTAGIPEYVADKIQGHAPVSQSRRYGSVPLATLRDAIELLPRYEVFGSARGHEGDAE